MARIEKKAFFIKSPVDKVFHMVGGEWLRLPEWNPYVLEVGELPPGFPQVDATVPMLLRVGRLKVKADSLLYAHWPPSKVGWKAGSWMLQVKQVWQFAPEGDGTLAHFLLDYRLSGSYLGLLMDKLVLERQCRRDMEAMLSKLKGLLEGEAGQVPLPEAPLEESPA